MVWIRALHTFICHALLGMVLNSIVFSWTTVARAWIFAGISRCGSCGNAAKQLERHHLPNIQPHRQKASKRLWWPNSLSSSWSPRSEVDSALLLWRSGSISSLCCCALQGSPSGADKSAGEEEDLRAPFYSHLDKCNVSLLLSLKILQKLKVVQRGSAEELCCRFECL